MICFYDNQIHFWLKKNCFTQITPKWNTLALKHLADRKCFPAIEWMCFRAVAKPRTKSSKRNNLNLILRIPENYLGYFGVKKWTTAGDEDMEKDGNAVRKVAVFLYFFCWKIIKYDSENCQLPTKLWLRRCWYTSEVSIVQAMFAYWEISSRLSFLAGLGGVCGASECNDRYCNWWAIFPEELNKWYVRFIIKIRMIILIIGDQLCTLLEITKFAKCWLLPSAVL